MPILLRIRWSLLVLAMPLFGTLMHPGKLFAQSADPLRVMSFNVRFGTANDGENRWELRTDLVKSVISEFAPDLMGTQELLQFQADFIVEQFPDYGYFGRTRMLDPDEQCGIFYRTSRFDWLAGGHFWLSETPHVPASKSWDSSLPRMASWVLLYDKPAAAEILLLNTHFDHRGQQARLESAKLIREQLSRLQKTYPNAEVIVTGDFNTPEASEPYRALLEDDSFLVDTYRQLHPEATEDEGTFNAFRGIDRGGRIDWILSSRGLRIDEASIVKWNLDGRYPSDHFPVAATFSYRADQSPDEETDRAD